jgi:AcrR family transcriptional regulator
MKDARSTEEIKSELLRTAQKHFALYGYQGANLSLIAKEARVANSLINYYYKGKEALFLAIIENSTKLRQPVLQRLLDEPRSREEVPLRLEFFIQGMLETFDDGPNLFEIIVREFRTGNQMIKELFEKHMLKNFMGVVGFFEQCREKGYLKSELDPVIVSQMLFTCICDVTRNDCLAKEYFKKSIEQEDHRKTVVHHILTLFLNGVMA